MKDSCLRSSGSCETKNRVQGGSQGSIRHSSKVRVAILHQVRERTENIPSSTQEYTTRPSEFICRRPETPTPDAGCSVPMHSEQAGQSRLHNEACAMSYVEEKSHSQPHVEIESSGPISKGN